MATSTPQEITILVVDDEEDVVEIISHFLREEGYNVLTAHDADEALSKSTPDVDCILLDVMLPGMSGFEIAKRLRGRVETEKIPIIMLTARSDEQDKITGLEIGADDYITKPFSPREMNARIKAVLRRRAPQMAGDAAEVADLRLDPATHRVTGNDLPIELGPTEFRLLHFLMAHPERVYSRAQLLDQVWGNHVFVEDRTVDVHIRRLRCALEATGHDGLVQTVRGSGYRLSERTEG